MSMPYAPLTQLPPQRHSNISLNEEVRLYSSPKERERYENLAELYSIVVSLDYLEKAFLKDSVSQQEYSSICTRLLSQYNTLLKDEGVQSEFVSLQHFKDKYGLDCSLATQRINVGIPASVVIAPQAASALASTSIGGIDGAGGRSTPTGTEGPSTSRAVAEATGNFITCMDALKLNYSATDQLHPLLGDLMTSLGKVTNKDFSGRDKIVKWLITLNNMKATESITDDQSRQLLFDLDNAYKGFFAELD
ncbi:Vacuolar protein sorting-associated protein 28 [Yarrowia sp. C11]|nr:Vacuolar protein sorting-associated protein 28 [Yarrowia sp. E02]KAG5369847.1 Vacuolar protein sorting-associated protein 28 [Yarrowia sp. C11]